MEGGAEREKGEREETEEREGLSMTLALKVWVSIVSAFSHYVSELKAGNSSRASGQAFRNNFNNIWRIE